ELLYKESGNEQRSIARGVVYVVQDSREPTNQIGAEQPYKEDDHGRDQWQQIEPHCPAIELPAHWPDQRFGHLSQVVGEPGEWIGSRVAYNNPQGQQPRNDCGCPKYDHGQQSERIYNRCQIELTPLNFAVPGSVVPTAASLRKTRALEVAIHCSAPSTGLNQR